MTAAARHETDWVSVHVFWEGGLDTLLTGAVSPLVAELAGEGLAREYFFLRYWDGGTHVRLRVLPAPGARLGAEGLIAGRLGDFLARNPSPDGDRSQRYLRTAPLLAAREQVPCASSLYPNNSAVFLPYRREHGRYGHGRAIQAAERHFADSSRISLRVLTMGATADQRAAACAAMIMLTWFIATPEPATGPDWAAGGDGRPFGPLLPTARQMRTLAATFPQIPATGTLVDWARSVAGLKEALTGQGFPAAAVPGVLDLCAHLVCNRLGIPPGAEAVLRKSSAGAVGALIGEGS